MIENYDKVIETHSSIVYLKKNLAYKFYKPVNFGFLDYSEIKSRKECMFKEFEINSKISPELYIEVKEV